MDNTNTTTDETISSIDCKELRNKSYVLTILTMCLNNICRLNVILPIYKLSTIYYNTSKYYANFSIYWYYTVIECNLNCKRNCHFKYNCVKRYVNEEYHIKCRDVSYVNKKSLEKIEGISKQMLKITGVHLFYLCNI